MGFRVSMNLIYLGLFLAPFKAFKLEENPNNSNDNIVFALLIPQMYLSLPPFSPKGFALCCFLSLHTHSLSLSVFKILQ